MDEHQTPFPDDLIETASHLNSAAIHLLRGLRAIDREAGMTPARLSALSVLVFGGPRPLGRLAAAEDVAGPTMTRIVDGLVDLGLAQRVMHPENGRMTLISATDAGRTLMERAARRRFDAIAGAMVELEDGEREILRAAGPVLRRLAGVLREQAAGR